MAGASIKGVVLAKLVDDVARVIGSGRLPQEEIEAHLRPEDLAWLERKPRAAEWVPIGSYTRLTELLWEAEGGRAPAYLERRGGDSARLLLSSGNYQQIDFLRERYDASARETARTSLKLVVTLQGSLLNFGRWQVEDDPEHGDRFQIRITEADEFPEVLGYATAGFMNAMSALRDTPVGWRYERPARDIVLFRMTTSGVQQQGPTE